MAYAVASGDTDRMARLLESLSFPLYRSGRMATLEPWFERFDDGALLARYPMVGVLGALLHALRGRTFQAERWLDAAAWSAGTSGPLADGSPSIRPWVAGVEAMLCRHGPERMGTDAAIAVAELGPFSPFRPPAMWLHATARLLQGDAAGADAELEHAVEAAAAAGASFAGITAVAQRALLALGRDDVALARALIEGADDFVGDIPYEDDMPMALVLVADARTDIREGDTGRALQHLAAAQRLRPYLAPAIPFLGVQTLVEMARAYLALGAVNDAEAALFDAREVLRHRPDLGVLRDRLVDGVLGSEDDNLTASSLDSKTHALVRLGALIVLDASPQSYVRSVEAALLAGATREEIVGTLIAAMPVVGSARVVSAAPKLGLALGYDLDAALEDELESATDGSA